MITEKRFKVVLTTLEPFRIGGKEDPLSGQDNPVAKVGENIVIPGTSLKGALRAEIEKYLIEKYKGKEEFKPCIPSTQISEDEKNLVDDGKYKDLFVGEKYKGCHYPCTDKDCKKTTHSICPVCYFCGAQGLPGFLRIPFLYANISVNELYSATIDRFSKVVKKGTNRPYQLISDNTEFTGYLSVLIKDDILNWEFGKPRPLKENTLGDKWLESMSSSPNELLAEFVINRLNSIEILGGYKSKGFGKVKIKVSNE